MSHSNIKAPTSPKCGRCLYLHYHNKEHPCNVCKDNSHYKEDIHKMSISEIKRERKFGK